VISGLIHFEGTRHSFLLLLQQPSSLIDSLTSLNIFNGLCPALGVCQSGRPSIAGERCTHTASPYPGQLSRSIQRLYCSAFKKNYLIFSFDLFPFFILFARVVCVAFLARSIELIALFNDANFPTPILSLAPSSCCSWLLSNYLGRREK
jgi:hypothetical protein